MHWNPQIKSNILSTSIIYFKPIAKGQTQLKIILLVFLYFYRHLSKSYFFLYLPSVVGRFVLLILPQAVIISRGKHLTDSWTRPNNMAAWWTWALKGQISRYMWVRHTHVWPPQCLHPLRRWGTSFPCTIYLLISSAVHILGSIHCIN